MKIIYVNRGASPSRFAHYMKTYNNQLQQQGQKYNQLLMEGLVAHGVEVTSLSTRPINRSMTKQKFFKAEKETENGILYDYIPFFNMKLLRELSVVLGVFFRILFAKGKKKDITVVCDGLNVAASMGVIAASALRGFKTVGIVTDVPGHLSYSRVVSRNQKINLALMRRFKSYLLLTQQMSEVVNPKNRPYIVLEGHADLSMADMENTLADKAEKKICLYAGSLMKIYGIGNLVQGFVKANVPNTELHIYGTGDYLEDIQALAKEHTSVKYMGVAPNSEIVKAEIRATLLVNPRPSAEDYTKYSFPSKNMEYMASGTPVLTTKLPGMPADHLEHVYLIEDESADGIASVLKELLTKSEEELFEKGKRAKDFVLKEKNNKKQAQKVLEMMRQA